MVATGLLVALSLASSMVALAFEASARTPDGSGSASGLTVAWFGVGMAVSVGVAALIIVRDRYPLVLVLVASAFAVVFPADTVAALVGLSAVVASQPRRRVLWAGALVAAVTALALVRDLRRPADLQIFSVKDDAGASAALPWWFFAVAGLMALGLAVGSGLYRRASVGLGQLRVESSRAAQTTADLRSELTRQEERDLIAREVHDTLAHRLSLVSLHSGALEVAARDHPELQLFAHEVQSNAHRSLEDLRGLIGVLRDPASRRADVEGAPATVTLEDLAELLGASRSAGSQMVATVLINDSASASAALTHAAYRIVQEALTNVHKHAPGAPLDVDLTASAAAGVRILVSNPLSPGATGQARTEPGGTGPPRAAASGSGAVSPPSTSAVPGAGAGLVGIHERARLLGGQARTGPHEGRFVVDVWLPWQQVTLPRG